MDAAQWPQQVGLARSMEEIISSNSPTQQQPPPPVLDSTGQRKVRPQKEHNMNCPRCNSTNTKFCYYNNYSLTQPRYLCKTCRRYWTQGGSLRNVPVGGGSRKNKRSTPPSSSSKFIPGLNPNPSNKTHDPPHGQDLNLSFPTSAPISALELLRTGISSSSFNSYEMPALMGPSYNIRSLRETTHHQERLLFSFEDISKFSSHQSGATNTTRMDHDRADNHLSTEGSSSEDHNHHNQGPSGHWNGMLGGW